ncbi:Spy/CpxP family protein refolding chaperone [Candidatus Omnitrophota bacterium]
MKMKIKQLLVTVLAVGSVVCAATVGYGQDAPDSEEGVKAHREVMAEKLAEELSLVPEQQEQLKALKTQHRSTKKTLRENLKSKNEELRKAIKDPATDRAYIDSVTAEIKQLQGAQLDLRVDHILKVKEILTPEQLEKFHSLEKKHRGKKGKWGHGGNGKMGHRFHEEAE